MADIERKEVLYCEVCTLPPEFCEFGTTLEKCKQWLQKEHPEEFEKLYSTGEGIEEKMGKATLDDKPAEEEKKPVKSKNLSKAEKELQKKQNAKVFIERVERNKRKCVTSVLGLEVFDIDLKKAAKIFANRFACGSSVAKNKQGLDEIVVQGDFSEEIRDLILENWSVVPENNIEFVEKKKKKATPA
ncbi:density-regulated protein DRP1 [Basidiobolus meristosporus CBS 931.73]|uniref:Translation machinery-associated protein 22 n=1 Tax=Basidiobolus meristosporus CBS 931.73 TaxID=1314790 RepID=A0A1Y1YEA1_9FUNG|nr:density-regulated protein DRP1 [Basidiobolus meristosporus CBS 931.73]|eukprot:ORX96253.1 density-regulated protein DRP1 [Basidiobolus meristosporus CBS 931.73]